MPREIYLDNKLIKSKWGPELEEFLVFSNLSLFYQILKGQKACYRENGKRLFLDDAIDNREKVYIKDKVEPIPRIATNIVNRITKLPIRERIGVITVATVPVGILGITTQEALSMYDLKLAEDLTVLPAEEILSQLLPPLYGSGLAAVIVISHSGITRDKELAENIKELDIIINASQWERASSPQRVGDVWILPQGCSIEEVEEYFGTYFPVEVRFFYAELLRVLRRFC